MIEKYKWSELNHLQVGKYGEYLVKMEFTSLGYDVYSAEVDNKGIDFVVRTRKGRYYDIQVKSVRGFNYIFFPKKNFSPCREKTYVRWFFKTGSEHSFPVSFTE